MSEVPGFSFFYIKSDRSNSKPVDRKADHRCRKFDRQVRPRIPEAPCKSICGYTEPPSNPRATQIPYP